MNVRRVVGENHTAQTVSTAPLCPFSRVPSLAQLLREARSAAGLTQREVATRLGKPASYPHKVETADQELNVIELMEYCDALGVDFN